MPKSPEKMQIVKERIFCAAMELFQQQGYEDTIVEQITKKAGVSKGTFFTHFSSKDAVFYEIGDMLLKSLEEVVKTGLQNKKSTLQITHECIRIISVWGEENKRLLKPIMTTCLYRASRDGISHRAILGELLRRGLEMGQLNGELRSDISAEDISSILIGLHLTIIYDWCNNEGQCTLEQKLRNCSDIIYKGVYRQKPVSL